MSEPEPVAWLVRTYDGVPVGCGITESEAEAKAELEEHAGGVGIIIPLLTFSQLLTATDAARAEGAREALEGAAAELERRAETYDREAAESREDSEGNDAQYTQGSADCCHYEARILRRRAAQLGQDADRG